MGTSSAARAEHMRVIVDGWASSNLSKQAYSRQCGVSYKLFLYWYRKHHPVTRRSGKKTATSSFSELEVTQSVPAVKDTGVGERVAFMELQLSGGRSLLFYEAVSIDYLKAILY